MASSADFVKYVCDSIAESGVVEARRMFGEYGIYVNGKPVLLFCDNTVFVKQWPCLAMLMADAETGAPYEGAREYYIIDADDRALLMKVIRTIEPVLEYPKKRRRKEKRRYEHQDI